MKRILTTLSQKWPEYLLEILVITFGILGAFSLENWNQLKRDEATKTVILSNLKDEFLANLIQLDTVLYYDSLVVQTSKLFMELIKTKELGTEAQTDSLFMKTQYLWSYDPSTGALRSAVSSGNIHLIKNAALINRLFSWEDLVKDGRENEERFIDHHLGTINQFYDRIQSSNSLNLFDQRIPKSHYKSDYLALLKDPLFENFLADKMGLVADAELELLLVRESIVEIIDLLEQE